MSIRRLMAYVSAAALTACATTGATPIHPVASPGSAVVTSPVRTDDSGIPRVSYDTVARPRDVLSARVGAADPGLFALRVQERLAEIQDRVHDEVWHGNLSPEAEEELTARRSAVLKAVRRAAADGVVTRDEQRQIDAMVRDLEQSSFTYVPMPRAWGGGMRYWR